MMRTVSDSIFLKVIQVSETTTIQLNKKTAADLRKIGTMGQTYDDVLQMLIDEHRGREGV